MLNDVWRKIGKEVGFFYEENFVDVPSSPGVYAWLYPLRVLSKSPEALLQFVSEVQTLLNYDSGTAGAPSHKAVLPAAWWSWSLAVNRAPKPFQLSDPLSRAWLEITANDKLFLEFQQSLLKASILMPPLYVGKADNLNTRCNQHLRGGRGSNDFHRRFEAFASDLNLPIRSVRHLIFACVRTGAPFEGETNPPLSPVHALVESIMKSICAPPYGQR